MSSTRPSFEAAAPLLMQFPRISATEIARQVGVTDRTVCNWLKLLGIPRRHHMPYARRMTEVGKCQTCGILLAEAEIMDGAGSDTLCLYCLGTLKPAPRAIGYGRDPIVAVLETLGKCRYEIGEGI